MSQRGQPDHSGYWVTALVLATIMIVFIVCWRTGLVRFIFTFLQVLTQK